MSSSLIRLAVLSLSALEGALKQSALTQNLSRVPLGAQIPRSKQVQVRPPFQASGSFIICGQLVIACCRCCKTPVQASTEPTCSAAQSLWYLWKGVEDSMRRNQFTLALSSGIAWNPEPEFECLVEHV